MNIDYGDRFFVSPLCTRNFILNISGLRICISRAQIVLQKRVTQKKMPSQSSSEEQFLILFVIE